MSGAILRLYHATSRASNFQLFVQRGAMIIKLILTSVLIFILVSNLIGPEQIVEFINEAGFYSLGFTTLQS